MRPHIHRFWLSFVLALALTAAVSPVALAGGGDESGGSDTDFTPLTQKHGVGSSVGLVGTTNSDGFSYIRTGVSCKFSRDLLTSNGGYFHDGITIQGLLIDDGIIKEFTDPDSGETLLVPGDGWEDRFGDFAFVTGGTGNCVQPGVEYHRAGCAGVLPGALTAFDHPIEGFAGVWVGELGIFIPGANGVSGEYLWVCAEAYDEAAFAAAVRQQTRLVEPRVTLEAQVRAAVGAEIGAWYSVADSDVGRDPFAAGFSISVPTRGDAIPADVVLWLEQIRWDMDGDGTWDIVETCVPPGASEPPASFDCGGSPSDPVGNFTFERRGLYDPVVELQWDGYYVAHFAFFDSRGDFNTSLMTTSSTLVDFPAVEIRSSLDG